jgi:TDG/mug DNA glycosylase family protein
MIRPPRPTKADLEAAHGKTLRDVLAPDLDIVFVGINPGLYTAAIGHHFGRPGNRFWKALHRAGLTDRLLEPWEDGTLPERGMGVTNLVARATASAAELRPDELAAGASALRRKLRRYRPRVVAFLGLDAYRCAFGSRQAHIGRRAEPLEGAVVWVLPNPSGLNASYQLPDFERLFGALRDDLATGNTTRTP